MNKYTPFLKLKASEVGALSELAPEIKNELIPFFDLAKKKDMTILSFQKMVKKSVASVTKNLTGINAFFLDNFDIDDQIIIDKNDNYGFVINAFSELNFIPVVGLDRAEGRNQLVFDYKEQGVIKSEVIAIRLLAEDFKSFELVRYEIEDLIKQGCGLFNKWVMILDNRVCVDIDLAKRVTLLVKFLTDSAKVLDFDSVIIAGSSIPLSIKDIADTESEEMHDRRELVIYHEAAKELDEFNLYLGDYTIVSPLYSDLTIPPEVMLNVTAAKIIYTHGWSHYVARGGALKGHARGFLQYNDLANNLISKEFYRGRTYSFGDEFLFGKANFFGTRGCPGFCVNGIH